MLTVPDAIPGTADLEVSQTEPPLLIDLGFGKGMNADISISQMVGQTKLGGGVGGGLHGGFAIHHTDLSEGSLGYNTGTNTQRDQVPRMCVGRVIWKVGASSMQMLSRRLER